MRVLVKNIGSYDIGKYKTSSHANYYWLRKPQSQ